jgi:hypothetical protein
MSAPVKGAGDHSWVADGHDKIGNVVQRCSATGCTVRKIENCSTFWQRFKGARWRDTEHKEVPPCAGAPAEVAPQPAPQNEPGSPAVWPLVVEELRASPNALWQRLADLGEARDAQGRMKYSVPLTVANGREPLVDLLQEAMDGMAYARQHHERVQTQASLDLYWAARAFALRVLAAHDGVDVNEVRP